MYESKKDRRCFAEHGRSAESKSFGQNFNPNCNYKPFSKNKQEVGNSIAKLIPVNGVISTEALKQITGLSVRQIRAAVKVARENGSPIMSDTSSDGGYWLSDDPAEIERCRRVLIAKATSILKTVSLMGKVEIDGQTSMSEVE